MMLRQLTTYLVTGLAAAAAGCSGSSGASSGTSNPAEGTYAGTITDANGSAISGARVAIDGIEARNVTGADGSFYVSDDDLSTATLAASFGPGIAGATTVEISVLAPGFDPEVGLLSVSPGERVNVDLVENVLDPEVTISQPSGDQTFVVDESCIDHAVEIEGFATLGAPDNFQMDLVLVIDRSGSTANPAFDVDDDEEVDTVLEAEVAAARCFVEGLDFSVTRVCIMSFSDEADTVVEFTSDLDELGAGLDTIVSPGGGTNYDAAFQGCEAALADLEAEDDAEAVDAELNEEELSTPFRTVVFLSDGITTAHGVPRDTSDSNLTQSTDDRHAAIDAASSLGDATNAQLFAYSFIPQNDANRKRTTLSHCVASCGGGKYQDLTDIRQLEESLCGVPLVSVLSVALKNVTIDSETVAAALNADGSFAASVPVAIAPEAVVGEANDEGVILNLIQVTVQAFSGAQARSANTTVAVRLLPLTTRNAMNNSELLTAQAAEAAVSDVSTLSSSTGRAINRNANLYDELVGTSAQFEDAIELYGVETFTATDPVEINATVTLDVIYKNACYASDVGYIIVDPNDRPNNPVQALRTIPLSQALFNTSNVGAGCGGSTLPDGTARFTFTVPSGSEIAFFLIPNRTLAEYQTRPNHWLKPLLTLPRLNPGKFDQVLEFRTVAGRTEPGASTTIDAAGPGMIFAFEDLAISRRNSDEDFDDLILYVNTETSGVLAESFCEDE